MTYWEIECEEMVRVLINDMSSSPMYNTDRITRLVVIAAVQVVNEINFDTTYTVDISLGTISPDPSNVNTKDNVFINLVCLKAAVILLDSELRYYAISSLRASDGPSSIDTSSRVLFVREAGKILQSRYTQLKMLQQMGQAGQAVLTPYTVPHIYTETRFQ